MLVRGILVSHDLLEGLRGGGGATLAMVDPVVKHIATIGFSVELKRHLVVLLGPHLLKVLLSVVSFVSPFATSVRSTLVKFLDTNTFLHVGHGLQITTVVYEGEL